MLQLSCENEGKMYVTLSGSSRTDIVRCDIQRIASQFITHRDGIQLSAEHSTAIRMCRSKAQENVCVAVLQLPSYYSPYVHVYQCKKKQSVLLERAHDTAAYNRSVEILALRNDM